MALDGGTAVVNVVASGAGLSSSIAGQMKGLTGTLKSAATAFGVGLGAAAAVGFGKEILNAANEAAQSTNRLAQAALKNTAIDVAALSEEFKRFGLEAAIDDERLKDLAAQLLQMGFKGSTAELEGEAEAIVNLGVATGRSESIIKRFFVALNQGNISKAITSAKTLGLVTEQQAVHYTALVKAGKAAQVQQLLLAQAQDVARGAAAAQATDVDKLTNRWNEFKEVLGGELTKNLTSLLDDLQRIGLALRPLADALDHFNASATATTGGTSTLKLAFDRLLDSINPMLTKLRSLWDAIKPLLPSQIDVTVATNEFSEAELKLLDAVAPVPSALADVAEAAAQSTQHLDKFGHVVGNFARMTKADLKEFRKAALENFAAVAGTISDTGEVFTLTAQEVIQGVNRMAKAQQRMANDLQKLDDLPIGDKLKERLINLGPEAVDGFVRGSSRQRGKIRAGLKSFDEAATDTNKAVKDLLTKGGNQSGLAFAQGAAAGTLAGSGAAAAAANRLGHIMIESLNSALGISSPSKEGEKAGKFLVEGLVVGMTKNFRLIERTLENLIPLMRQALGEGAADQAKSFLRDLETMDKRFEKLKTRIGNFRSAIRGAFVDASDLIGTIGAALEQFRSDQEQFLKDQASFTGAEGQLAPVAPQSPDLQALVAAQVAQAQQLAKLLKQLQGQGLSTANLAQIAGQGAGGIPIAEALLADPALIAQLNDAQQAIADITQQTADKLTAAAFGDKVERMGTELDDLLSELQKFKRGLQVPALTDETSEFIRQLQRLNDALASLGIGPGGGSGNTGAAVRDALLTLKRRNVTTGL